jgi:hypothetical protein
MSFVSTTPDIVASAAGNLAGIGSGLSAANASAATSTTAIAAAAEDEVSTALAGLFGTVGQQFQAASAQAQAFHEQFVGTLNAGTGQYVSTEAANAQQSLLNAVNAPVRALLGNPAAAARSAATVPISQSGTQSTPLGPVSLTLNGFANSLTGQVTLTSGSIGATQQLVLGLDLAGAPLAAQAGWANTNAGIVSAMQTGNPLGAAFALANAPYNVLNGFFVGQAPTTVPFTPPAGSGYSSSSVTVPLGGLFAPNQPATFTATSTNGATTSFPLAGPSFGGVIRALAGF